MGRLIVPVKPPTYKEVKWGKAQSYLSGLSHYLHTMQGYARLPAEAPYPRALDKGLIVHKYLRTLVSQPPTTAVMNKLSQLDMAFDIIIDLFGPEKAKTPNKFMRPTF